MHLIDVLINKTKYSQILSFFIFFFLLLLSIHISMLFCKFYTHFMKKTREGDSNCCFSIKKKYNTFFFIIVLFNYISIFIFFSFFSLYPVVGYILQFSFVSLLFFFSKLYIIFIEIDYFSFTNLTLNSGNFTIKTYVVFICNIFNCLNENKTKQKVPNFFFSIYFSFYILLISIYIFNVRQLKCMGFYLKCI
jgi:hypothetical protein